MAIDRAYLLSLPERLVRSVVALGAGLTREVGEVALPDAVRQGQLYQNLVESTLRFLIERVGGAEGVYDAEARQPDDFLVRRTAGNALEVLGLVAFRASPVWILAALADLCGLGRHLIPQIAEALKAQQLLDPEATFENVDQLLDGLERTTSRMASTVNTPPLDVAALRTEWHALRQEARALTSHSLPSAEAVTGLWEQLRSRGGSPGDVGVRGLVDDGRVGGPQRARSGAMALGIDDDRCRPRRQRDGRRAPRPLPPDAG